MTSNSLRNMVLQPSRFLASAPFDATSANGVPDRDSWSPTLRVFTLAVLLGIAAWLRLADLGYSEFQGDEIKALAILKGDRSLLDFLLEQRKGPVQFTITYLYSFYDPAFANPFLVRLPFAVAGIASVWVFYKLVRLYFSDTVAIYAAFLMATNGLFVAFSRIVQYQAIVILGTLLCLFFLSLAVRDRRYRISGIYLASFAFLLTCLAHFDGIALLLPCSFLLLKWLSEKGNDGSVIHIFAGVAVILVPISTFYLLLFFNVNDPTLSYWSGRISGYPSDSFRVFSFYNGWPATVAYLIGGVVGLFVLFRKPLGTIIFVLLWFLPMFLAMEGLMTAPRTHIYVYVLPGMILMALALDFVARELKRLSDLTHFPGRLAPHVPGALFILFLFGTTQELLVDHRPEYPWEPKKVFFFEAPGRGMPGTMGFPYRRQWAEAAAWLDANTPHGKQRYTTNEKMPLVRFYLPKRFKVARPCKQMSTKTIYALQVDRTQKWQRRIYGLPDPVDERFEPLVHFRDEDGRPLITIYRTTAGALCSR